MRTLKQKIDGFEPAYPLKRLAPIDKILFLDIETTGFAAQASSLYLIGCAYYQQERWNLIQWFANHPGEEPELLKAFFTFSAGYSLLIHFNGNHFDLPYLLQKCAQYSLPYDFSPFTGIDLYKRTSPYKEFLRLPNCKQKTLEDFFGVKRADPFNGGELISIYHSYQKEPADFAFQALVLHNADDMRGMLEILPVLAYSDLFQEPPRVKKAQANYYSDYNGEKHQELLMQIKLNAPLTKPVTYVAKGCYFTGEGLEASIRVPIYEEELKYFYSNYKDYYYLPSEDVALHKSVASFVDKAHREQALASNCYTRKFSTYLPQWELEFEPFFKRDYKSKELFFELTEDKKTQRGLFSKYAAHILQMMARDAGGQNK